MTYKTIVGNLAIMEVEKWVRGHVKDSMRGLLARCEMQQLSCDSENGCIFEIMVKVPVTSIVDQEYSIHGYITGYGSVTITSVSYEYTTMDPVKSRKSEFLYGSILNYFYFDIMGYSFPEE